MTKDGYPKDWFKYIRILCILSGLWMPKVKTSFVYKCYFYFILILTCTIYPILEVIILKETYKDLSALGKTLSMLLQHASGSFKCVYWLRNYNTLIHLMKLFEDDKYHYESFGKFVPHKVIISYKRVIEFGILFYCTLATLVSMASAIPVVVDLFFDPKFLEPITGIYGEKLPYYVWTPFDLTTSRLTFGLVLSFAWFNMLMYGLVISALDLTMLTIAHYLTAHTIILQGAILTIRQRAFLKVYPEKEYDTNAGDVSLERETDVELSKCIHHSWEILRIREDAESVYNQGIFLQYMITLIMSCFTLYTVSMISVSSPNFMPAIVYLMAVYVQISTLSWFGNEITFEWGKLLNAISESDWYLMSEKNKKAFAMMMVRFQRPIYLSIGKFSPLGLNSLLTVIRLSYSIFNLLRQSQAKHEAENKQF